MTHDDGDDELRGPIHTVTLSEVPGDRRHALVRKFSLRVIEGPDKGVHAESRAERLTLGTHESNTGVLSDRAISRFHCEIVLIDGVPRVRDLGSMNGTLVDGVPVIEAPLRDGSTLTLGHTHLAFELLSDHNEVQLTEEDAFEGMVGRTPVMRAMFARLLRAAPTDATVLLGGETGSGKDIAAESLHLASKRRDAPFVVLDCGAMPPNILDSELFGHEKGAFTGAHAAREGAFEAAHGGTLFLDEVGELSIELQPKLLRAIERREVKRVGANKYRPVDVRVIAATNRSLRADVNAKTFRADLFFRLAVIEIQVPSLREHLDDLPLLVEAIVPTLLSRGQAMPPLFRSPEFLAQLRAHSWPGNVRELRNHLERCLALADSPPIEHVDPAGALPSIDISRPIKEAREAWVAQFERGYLEAMLAANEGNVSKAARAAKIDRIHFYRMLWKHGLK